MVSFKSQEDNLNFFVCLQEDYPEACMPDKRGLLDGQLLLNGDNLFVMDTMDVYSWDAKNKKWLD